MNIMSQSYLLPITLSQLQPHLIFETWSHVATAGLDLSIVAEGDLELLVLLLLPPGCWDERHSLSRMAL